MGQAISEKDVFQEALQLPSFGQMISTIFP